MKVFTKLAWLLLFAAAFTYISPQGHTAGNTYAQANKQGDKPAMKIKVTSNGKNTVFQLNSSTAARELYAQLPLNIKVENFGGNEKIFYPPKKLATDNTPRANAEAGSLSYYAPWGDVVMFYKDFGSASGLYELGKAVSGAENISAMSGTISINKED